VSYTDLMGVGNNMREFYYSIWKDFMDDSYDDCSYSIHKIRK